MKHWCIDKNMPLDLENDLFRIKHEIGLISCLLKISNYAANHIIIIRYFHYVSDISNIPHAFFHV